MDQTKAVHMGQDTLLGKVNMQHTSVTVGWKESVLHAQYLRQFQYIGEQHDNRRTKLGNKDFKTT